MCQRIVGRAVELELEDVNVVGSFHYAVHAPLALLLFGIYRIDAHEAEYQVERVVEVPLPLPLVFLAPHGVGYVGEERREQLAQLVGVAILKRVE